MNISEKPEIINLKLPYQFLSEHWEYLPSNVMLNKSVTGCGATHLELNSKRDSIILLPYRKLIDNKMKDTYLKVDGKVRQYEIKEYLSKDIKYKKILGTYDSLEKIIKCLNPVDWFLMIDEYHILFNQYKERIKPFTFLLKNFRLFPKYCFVTATPLNSDTILDELKDIDVVNLEWDRAVDIKATIKDTTTPLKELKNIIFSNSNVNYHIFINSVSAISGFIETLPNKNDCKVVCSEAAERSIRNLKKQLGSTLDPPKKYNFYTATAFEGQDIYDKKGVTIIYCDKTRDTTILDISTLIRQICGRLRDSVYKNEVTIILNTKSHRYVKDQKSKWDFKKYVEQNIKTGQYRVHKFKTDPDPMFRKSELRIYTDEAFNSIYVNKYEDELYFDDNLRKVDEHNYKVVNEVYQTSIKVIMALQENEFIIEEWDKSNWAADKLEKEIKKQDKDEFTFQELKEIFKKDCEKRKMKFAGSFITNYLPEHLKCRKMINDKRNTYYKFKK